MGLSAYSMHLVNARLDAALDSRGTAVSVSSYIWAALFTTLVVFFSGGILLYECCSARERVYMDRVLLFATGFAVLLGQATHSSARRVALIYLPYSSWASMLANCFSHWVGIYYRRISTHLLSCDTAFCTRSTCGRTPAEFQMSSEKALGTSHSLVCQFSARIWDGITDVPSPEEIMN